MKANALHVSAASQGVPTNHSEHPIGQYIPFPGVVPVGVALLAHHVEAIMPKRGGVVALSAIADRVHPRSRPEDEGRIRTRSA